MVTSGNIEDRNSLGVILYCFSVCILQNKLFTAVLITAVLQIFWNCVVTFLTFFIWGFSWSWENDDTKKDQNKIKEKTNRQ